MKTEKTMRYDIMGETYGTDGPVKRPDGILQMTVERARRFKYGAEDFIREWGIMGVLVCLGLAAMMAIIAAMNQKLKDKAAHEAHFMAECQQDKKHYECEAMWRAGEDHEHMIPVVIPMPSGR